MGMKQKFPVDLGVLVPGDTQAANIGGCQRQFSASTSRSAHGASTEYLFRDQLRLNAMVRGIPSDEWYRSYGFTLISEELDQVDRLKERFRVLVHYYLVVWALLA